MRSVYVGIDIGEQGYICISSRKNVSLIKLGDDPARTLARVLVGFKRFNILPVIVIEKTFAFKGMSAVGSHTLGLAAGRILGTLEALDAPYRAVRPQEWKALILKGTDKSKDAAVAYVQNAYPSLNINRPKGKPDHNAAEAVCLAEYARRISQ